jgi:hypothetical protein
MTADDFLRRDVGELIASLLFQLAVVKAENERLRAACDGPRVPADGALRGAP